MVWMYMILLDVDVHEDGMDVDGMIGCGWCKCRCGCTCMDVVHVYRLG